MGRDAAAKCNDRVIEIGQCVEILEEALERIQSTEKDFDIEEVTTEIELVRKEVEEMRAQWMRLGGHANPQQRIQHLLDVKMENNQLRDELMYTRKQLLRGQQDSIKTKPC